ncbi:MAG: transaldolase [Candidatus Micrarchaeota archaeon]|nr:transaldolase [Candidatus Micrarchaeota archaeon]MDE1834136.1 transaldolase [Candidatus Micrarchaeota archaeon]MDE1859537.1 transaldolase [Candidatus Micrarchaeota archaeon]
MRKFKIKLFGDGADLKVMKELYDAKLISGFTTNPTLMRNAGVTNYEAFAKSALEMFPDVPISFEVFSDDFTAMEKEARKISRWGDNVYTKIPITNTKGESSLNLIKKLSAEGLKLNITAILTIDQVKGVSNAVSDSTPSIVSVFAGRIADTGRDPVPVMKSSYAILKQKKHSELLWASSRELFNIMQAEDCGCHIITVTNEILKKLKMLDKDLNELSLDTVKMFYNDAKSMGYNL